jgi:hypothetical protein
VTAVTDRMTEVWNASSKQHENNDCTVKALAIATGLDYSVVHAAFTKAGRKNRKGCNRRITKIAAAALGFDMEPTVFSAKTAITVERDRRLQSGRYVIGMTRHLAAMVDGKLHDWSKGRRKRINNVWTLTPIATPTPAPIHEGPAKWLTFAKYTKQDNRELFT